MGLFKINFEEAIDAIQKTHEQDLSTINYLKETNKELKDKHYKDVEIQKMKNLYDEMLTDYKQGFPITDEEKNKITSWQEQHLQKSHNGKDIASVSGGNWIYEFIPTTIGDIKHYRCEICYRKAQAMAFANGEDWTKHDIADKYINMYDAELDFSNWY